MIRFGQIQLVNLIGMFIAIMAFLFGHWPAQLPQGSMNSLLLFGLTLSLAGAGLALGLSLGKKRLHWVLIETGFALAGIQILILLYALYGMHTSGVMLTGLGVLVAELSSLLVVVMARPERETAAV